jgi:hypothetical protein
MKGANLMAIIRNRERLGSTLSFLDTLEPLEECSFSPQLVNIVNHDRFNKDLVQLESFIRFAKDNGFDDAGETLHYVCEANCVPESYRNTLGFVVNEYSILADAEIFETMVQLQETGMDVYVAPISSVSPYYTRLTEALELDEDETDFANCVNLHQYINESIFSDAKDKISSGYNTVKAKVSGAIDEVSKKMASVRKKISEKKKELEKAVGDGKVFISRQIDKLKNTYNSLKSKLISLKKKAGQKVSVAINSVKSTAKNAGNWVSDKYDSAKKTVSSGIDAFKNKIGMGKK